MKRLILIAMVLLFSASTVLAQSCYPDYGYPPCEGNLDYDCDVDANDVVKFLDSFGRNPFLVPCPPSGPAMVEKTGQTTSYATSDDGDLERGVAWPNPRFNDNGDGTVSDNLTGLIWLKNANCFGTRTWNNALSDCNGLSSGICGLTDGSNAGDWRLPNVFELESLRNMKYWNPALSNTVGTGQWSEGDPFNNVQLDVYWSSTTFAYNTSYAWLMYVVKGEADTYTKAYPNYVWPVRGGH